MSSPQSCEDWGSCEDWVHVRTCVMWGLGSCEDWGHVRTGVMWRLGSCEDWIMWGLRSCEDWVHVRTCVMWGLVLCEDWGHVRTGVMWGLDHVNHRHKRESLSVKRLAACTAISWWYNRLTDEVASPVEIFTWDLKMRLRSQLIIGNVQFEAGGTAWPAIYWNFSSWDEWMLVTRWMDVTNPTNPNNPITLITLITLIL